MVFGVLLIDEEVHVAALKDTVEVHTLDAFIRYLTITTQFVLFTDVCNVTLNELLPSLGVYVQHIFYSSLQARS